MPPSQTVPLSRSARDRLPARGGPECRGGSPGREGTGFSWPRNRPEDGVIDSEVLMETCAGDRGSLGLECPGCPPGLCMTMASPQTAQATASICKGPGGPHPALPLSCLSPQLLAPGAQPHQLCCAQHCPTPPPCVFAHWALRKSQKSALSSTQIVLFVDHLDPMGHTPL